MSHPYRKIGIGLCLVLLIAASGGIYYWWNSTHVKPTYVFADVTRGDIEESVSVTGSINPRNTVQVGSYVSGTVKSLYCDFNTQVKAGQICAKIDPSTFQVAVDQSAAQLNSSRSQLHKDEAALVYAKGVYERDLKLLKDGVVAQEVADNDKNVYQQAVAQIDLDKATIVAQEASLKSAVVNLGYTNIVSPVNGTVLTRNVDVGQTVASSLQTPTLFLIGKDLTKMQVDANVSEADVGRIQVDQDVSFTVQAYPDKTFSGTVKQIRRGPITVQNVVTYDVVVAVDNPELRLFPGMTADAEIVTDSRENVLRVPLAATRFTPEHGKRNGDSARADAGNTGNGNTGARNGQHGSAHNGKSDDASSGRHTSDKAGDNDSNDNASASASANAKSDNTAPQTEHNHTHGGRGDNPSGGNWKHANGNENSSVADQKEHHGHRHTDSSDAQSAQTEEQADKNTTNGSNRKDTKDDGKTETAVASETVSVAKPESQAPKHARVWVLRDGVPHPVRITTGLDDGETIEVISGDLKEGDQVIVNEVRPVETKSTPIQSPFNTGGRRGGGFR